MKKTLHATKKKPVIIAFGVLALVVIGGLAAYRMTHKALEAETVIYSTDTPSEERPGKDFEWKGGPDDPKKINIPAIGVDAYVQNVGVDQKGEVAVPNNLFVVGWFTESVRPGEKGLSVIDGHVTGRQNNGIFKDLEKLNEGDTYTIEFGNSSTKTFKVIGKQSVPVSESVSVIFSQNPKVSNQLNLVTCSGKFDSATRSYNERLTVFSEQI